MKGLNARGRTEVIGEKPNGKIEEGDLSLSNLRSSLCCDIPIADDKHPAIFVVVVELLEDVRSRVGGGGVAEGDHHHPQRVAVQRQAAF